MARCMIALHLLLLCGADYLLADESQNGDSQPIAHWAFDSTDDLAGDIHGEIRIAASELQQPRYPEFPAENKVLELKAPAWLSITDTAEETRWDFDNGDAITLEAWVRVDKSGENMCIVSKGRTGNSGQAANNQNWAFRLRKQNGQSCVNFLFRSRPSETHKGDWHRWTSTSGFSSGSRWHHVAVSYKFGEPKSIRGFIDGKKVFGKWDMGGATEQPPVVDNDDVWIGSTMAGNIGNSLDGAIDNLTVHRREVSTDELKARFRWNPPPVKPPTILPGKVTVQLFGPVDSIAELPLETDEPLTEWHQDEMAFVRLPHKYDSWGVREDWGKTLFVRAWADIVLPEGEHQLLARTRGLARLKIDDVVMLTTPAQQNRSGAHHVVDPIPEVPRPDMRPHAMSDNEHIVSFTSDGKSHRFLYEIIVGGPNYRAEFGETCVAVASGDSMFYLLSSVSEYPLTDDGWQSFVSGQSLKLTNLDQSRRQQANAMLTDFWQRRHNHARQSVMHQSKPQSIDDLIAGRIKESNAAVGTTDSGRETPASVFFTQHVQPIFDAHCTRCHGQKEQGGLLIVERARLLQGGESGEPAVVPGKPHDSYLFQLVSAAADDYRMPPKGDGLTAEQINIVKQWITDGAQMPTMTSQRIEVPAIVDNHTFLRRVFIDTVGVPPTVAEAMAFLTDAAVNRREQLIDRLLSDDRWADNWVGYWQDVLAENPNLLKPTLNNTGPFRYWIHEALIDNKPIDRFATELILMRGSTWGGGAAGFSVASQNDVPMAAKGQVIASAFLGVNMKCARCHDAPYHQWKQADLFQMAAMLDRKALKLPKTSTVPAAFFEKQERKSLIEVSLKAGADIAAHFPFAELAPLVDEALLQKPDDTREQLAAQVTASRRFAEVIANRVWKRLMGAALVDPVDDWEASPPLNPELLETLADGLISADYDLKQLTRRILVSHAYQREASDLPPSRDRHFAGPYRRRMSAEQIVDSAVHAAGRHLQTEQLTMDVEGTLPANTFMNFGYPKRSWEFTTLANERDRPSLALPRIQAVADVLKAFGWRNSRPEPKTDREEEANLIQPGVLANGSLGIWLTRLTDDSGLTSAMLKAQPVEDLVDELFLRLLTRLPTEAEHQQFVALLQPDYDQRVVPKQDIGTAHEDPKFPYVSWSNHLNTEANVIKVEMQELVRRGPPPTRYLQAEWRERAEDAVWSLLNSPEMILIP
jgi:mono/diheme cytochrome c family protein